MKAAETMLSDEHPDLYDPVLTKLRLSTEIVSLKNSLKTLPAETPRTDFQPQNSAQEVPLTPAKSVTSRSL